MVPLLAHIRGVARYHPAARQRRAHRATRDARTAQPASHAMLKASGMDPLGGFDRDVLSSKSAAAVMVHGHQATVESLHDVAVHAAASYIESLHRARCTENTPLLFVRLDCHGVGGDLLSAVRGFAAAVDERRQMVLLPPTPSRRRSEKLPAWLNLTAREPWHWLVGHGFSLDTVFVKSACQKRLEKRAPEVLEAIAQSEELAHLTARRLGYERLANASKDFGQHAGAIGSSSWRKGVRLRIVPSQFRRQGILWWYQVLTSYVVRIRGALRDKLEQHPAMAELTREYHTASASAVASTAARPMGFAVCGSRGAAWPSCACPNQEALEGHRRPRGATATQRRFCDGIGPGWFPEVRFDASIHIRAGDACGAHQGASYRKSRACGVIDNISAALDLLRASGLRHGRLFVATDSDRVVRHLAEGPALAFQVTMLKFSRAHYSSTTPTEVRTGKEARLQVLLEALLDSLLLSRAETIVGPMMSNFARVALQLRVQPPMAKPRYVALDGRPWCSRTSCKRVYVPNQGF